MKASVRVRRLEESSSCVAPTPQDLSRSLTVQSHSISTIHSFESVHWDGPTTSRPKGTQGGSQEEIFSSMGIPLLQNMLNGVNVCVLTYGAAGSGKTYSLYGPKSSPEEAKHSYSQYRGFVPRMLSQLNRRIKSQANNAFEVSIVQIRGDAITDLLTDNDDKLLSFINDPTFGAVIEDAIVRKAVSDDELQEILAGANRRAMRRDAVHQSSSTTILTVTLPQQLSNDPVPANISGGNSPSSSPKIEHQTPPSLTQCCRNKLMVFDLEARSEDPIKAKNILSFEQLIRALSTTIRKSKSIVAEIVTKIEKKSLPVSPQRTMSFGMQSFRSMRGLSATSIATEIEGATQNSNDSLEAISRTESKRSLMSSASLALSAFQDSIVTQLLRECFGFNWCTTMLAVVRGDISRAEETAHTLKIASLARVIISQPSYSPMTSMVHSF